MSMMGSNRFPIDMPRFVNFYMVDKLKLEEMVSRRIPLSGIYDALDELKRARGSRPVRDVLVS